MEGALDVVLAWIVEGGGDGALSLESDDAMSCSFSVVSGSFAVDFSFSGSMEVSASIEF